MPQPIGKVGESFHYSHVNISSYIGNLSAVFLFCWSEKANCSMRSKLQAATYAGIILLFIIVACRKETPNNSTATFDSQLLKGGTWTDHQSSSSLCTMKFRFYGDAKVTYAFRTSVYPSLKYDSFPNGRWELIQPDTIRLYDRSWNYYGYLQVQSLTKSELRSRMPGYNDIIVFTKEN